MGEATQFLREWENEALVICNRVAVAQWMYATNITEYNKKQMVSLKNNHTVKVIFGNNEKIRIFLFAGLVVGLAGYRFLSWARVTIFLNDLVMYYLDTNYYIIE